MILAQLLGHFWLSSLIANRADKLPDKGVLKEGTTTTTTTTKW